LKIYAWVVLANHLHAILAGPDLPRTIAALKKFTAHEILGSWKLSDANGSSISCGTFGQSTRPQASIRSGRRAFIRNPFRTTRLCFRSCSTA
jgi:hypothetical protein